MVQIMRLILPRIGRMLYNPHPGFQERFPIGMQGAGLQVSQDRGGTSWRCREAELAHEPVSGRNPSIRRKRSSHIINGEWIFTQERAGPRVYFLKRHNFCLISPWLNHSFKQKRFFKSYATFSQLSRIAFSCMAGLQVFHSSIISLNLEQAKNRFFSF